MTTLPDKTHGCICGSLKANTNMPSEMQCSMRSDMPRMMQCSKHVIDAVQHAVWHAHDDAVQHAGASYLSGKNGELTKRHGASVQSRLFIGMINFSPLSVLCYVPDTGTASAALFTGPVTRARQPVI